MCAYFTTVMVQQRRVRSKIADSSRYMNEVKCTDAGSHAVAGSAKCSDRGVLFCTSNVVRTAVCRIFRIPGIWKSLGDLIGMGHLLRTKSAQSALTTFSTPYRDRSHVATRHEFVLTPFRIVCNVRYKLMFIKKTLRVDGCSFKSSWSSVTSTSRQNHSLHDLMASGRKCVGQQIIQDQRDQAEVTSILPG